MEKTQTALMRAIESIKAIKDSFNSPVNERLDDAIAELTKLLPKEASQLDTAICYGYSYEFNTKGMIPLDDYSHKYLLETYGIDYEQMMKQAYAKQDTK